MRSRQALMFFLRCSLQIVPPLVLGILLVLIGGAEIGSNLRQAIGVGAWGSTLLPFGVLLWIAGTFISAKLTTYRSSGDGIYLGGTRHNASDVKLRGSFLGICAFEVSGLTVFAFKPWGGKPT